MRAALVAIVAAVAIGGGFAAAGVLSGSGPAARDGLGRSTPLAAHTGRVTGYIDPCEGIDIGLPYAAGTVTALRGRQTWKLVASESNRTYQTYRLVLPAAVAAREHVSQNQTFSFDLAPGRYVLVGRYDDGGGGATYADVTIAAGTVLHRDLPDLCK